MSLEREILKKQAESRNLESYTSMMSHEFRTPLATAIMLIDMMLRTLTEAVCLRYCQIIKVSLSLLLSLVNDMVDLKLVKEKMLEPKFKVFSPAKVLDFVVSLL